MSAIQLVRGGGGVVMQPYTTQVGGGSDPNQVSIQNRAGVDVTQNFGWSASGLVTFQGEDYRVYTVSAFLSAQVDSGYLFIATDTNGVTQAAAQFDVIPGSPPTSARRRLPAATFF